MANSNNGQILIIGVIGLAAVYMFMQKQTTTTPNQTPPVNYPPPATQQQQLMQWAQTQSAGSTILNIIKGLDWNGIADMWGKIFGGSSGSSSTDISGGGSDTPYNPYPEYDPYNSGDIWA